MILYSGHKSDETVHGKGFSISRRIMDNVLQFEHTKEKKNLKLGLNINIEI